MHYSNRIGEEIYFKSIEFAKTKLILEDNWLVQFFPKNAARFEFLKVNKNILSDHKPYGTDPMNKGAINNKGKTIPEMMLYFNILLSNEELTNQRMKYTWLDSFSLVGGFVDLVMLALGIFFSFYNYRLG